MLKYQGKGVYGAVAVGKISVFKRQDVQVRREKTEDTASELKRLENAKAAAIEQLQEIYEKALREVGEANAAIFEIHMMMVEDEDYNDAITEMITTQNVNAEYAVAITGDNFAEMFAAMDDAYMQARSADVRDISNRIINCLMCSVTNEEKSNEPVIICADDLAPSETVSLDKDKVLAFVTAHGSSNSHTAILARNMNIPAIIGVGEEFLSAVKDGDIAVANGFTGEFILDPDAETIEAAEIKRAEEQEKKELLQKLKGKENVTLDGRKINIYANIGSADNIGAVLLNDAGGIGLFRSEFLYLGKNDYPTEEEQYLVYKQAAQMMAGKKVIIRTLDIGADKQADYLNLGKEENPALGYRAIRICLTQKEIFKTQLKALFRAAKYGNLAIMYPMIISTKEVEQIKQIVAEVEEELKAAGVEYLIPEQGIMIETPASVMMSDELAQMVAEINMGHVELADRLSNQVYHYEKDLRKLTMATDTPNKRLDGIVAEPPLIYETKQSR